MVKKLEWLKESQRLFLSRGYLSENETPELRYQIICDTIQNIVNEYKYSDNLTSTIGERFERYIEKGWVSFATPVLKNFGKSDNLSISCNKSTLSDSLDDIYKGLHELGMLAKYGAGTSQNFSSIRPIGSEISSGGKSNSVMDWVELYADMMSKTAQNSARRGFLTAYLSADHPEVMDFLDIGTHRLPKEKQRFFQTITTGITLPKGFRKALKEGDTEKRKVWAKILNTRKEVGFPYIVDLENANNQKPERYKELGLDITTSNICNEIMEYTDEEKTFSCCLSSVNLYHFDDWKDDKQFIFDMNLMLDCVISEYIEQTKGLPGFEKARKFCIEHRAIGLGTLGLHSYFQKNKIAFGSMESFQTNHEIFSLIRQESDRASKWMAENWGEPLIMKGIGFRNSTRMAQAPTKSTAFIMGGDWLTLSEGIEPHKSNFNEKKLAKIQVEFKNSELKNLLVEKEKDTEEVWDSILESNGSVQHLDFLSDHEKEVFKTFPEISQVDVIKLAGQRQKFIDQGQSVNLMIHPDASPKQINELHLLAFDEGLKGLYYQYGISAAQKFNQDMLTCSNCEG